MKRDEERLQMQVAWYLDQSLPIGAAWWHTPNGGRRDAREGAKLKRMGVKAGVPDILICHNARAIFIELKAGKGGLSKPQKEMHTLLLEANFHVATCRSLGDVDAVCRLFMPMRGRIAA